MGIAADRPRRNSPRTLCHGDRPEGRSCSGVREEDTEDAACRDRTCAAASEGDHMPVPFERLKASMTRSLRSSRFPPSCCGLGCAPAYPRLNWLPGWALANPPSHAWRAARLFRVPSRSCATPRRPAASFMCGCRQLDAPLAPLPAIISCKIVRWGATVDEDGRYCFAVAL